MIPALTGNALTRLSIHSLLTVDPRAYGECPETFAAIVAATG